MTAQFRYDMFYKDTTKTGEVQPPGGKSFSWRNKYLNDRLFYGYAKQVLGRLSPAARAMIYLSEVDPLRSRAHWQAIDDYLERENFLYVKQMRRISAFDVGSMWSQTKPKKEARPFYYDTNASCTYVCPTPGVPTGVIGHRYSLKGTSRKACDISAVAKCLGGQVPNEHGSDYPVIEPVTDFWGKYHYFGPAIEISPGEYRMKFDIILYWPYTGPGKDTLKYAYPVPEQPEVPATVLPIPNALTPPVPSQSVSVHPKTMYVPRMGRYEAPAVTYDIDPETSVTTITNGTHRNVPPEPGVRENKRGRISRGGLIHLLAALNEYWTEANDYVDIAFDALPKKYRCKGARTIVDKANCVYRNLDHLDVQKLIEGLLWNRYEDRLAGWFFGHQRKAPFGVGLSQTKAPPVWVHLKGRR